MSQWLQLIITYVLIGILSVGCLPLITSSYCEGRYGKCPEGDRRDPIVEYPFHIQSLNSNEYCGYPELAIKCAQDGRPLINISNQLYYYYSLIDYSRGNGSFFTVVDVDIDGQPCPHPRHNFSLEAASALQLYTSYRNVTIFYNCTNAPENEVQHLPCLNNNNTGLSYAFVDDHIPPGFNWYGNCQETVVVPMSYYAADLLIEADYRKALKEGFDLYRRTPIECKRCERSGGQCWSNNTTIGVFSCLCSDRTMLFSEFCPNGMVRGFPLLFILSKLIESLVRSL